jgi:hypothetical protein
MRTPSIRRALYSAALAAGLAGALPAFAQSGRAELTGEIRDEAGAVVPDGKVTVTAVATGQAVSVTTGPAGTFNVPYLRPGSYRVEAEAPGCRRSVREGVQLATGERVRIDLVLAVGAFTDATTVTADAPILQTETSSLGQVIPNRSVLQLPLNGRSFLPLVALVPGVALPRAPRFRASTAAGRASTSTSSTASRSSSRSRAPCRISRSWMRSRNSRSSPTRPPPSSAASTAA